VQVKDLISRELMSWRGVLWNDKHVHLVWRPQVVDFLTDKVKCVKYAHIFFALLDEVCGLRVHQVRGGPPPDKVKCDKHAHIMFALLSKVCGCIR
jgi:hypothetical protein